jgi:hypothetical protein
MRLKEATMSLVGMSDAKVTAQIRVEEDMPTPRRPRKRNRTQRAADQQAAGKPAPVGVPANIVNQLVLWIPVETITLYVGYLALFDPAKPTAGTKLCANDFTWRWVGFGVFCFLTTVIVLGTYIGKRREAGKKPPFKVPIFEMVFGTVAFAAWAAALPETPFADVCGYKASYGGYAVAAATAGISFLAWVVGKTPFYEKK